MSMHTYVPHSRLIHGAVVALAASATALFTNDAKPRRFVKVFNNGPNKIFIGGSTVTNANGYGIAAGGSETFEVGPGVALYVCTVTADQVSPADTRYMVVG